LCFTPGPLYPRVNSPPPPYPLVRRLGGPQRRYGPNGKDKDILSLSGIKPRTIGRRYTDYYVILAEMPGVARVEISKPAIVGRLEVSPAIDPAGPAPPNMMRF
jgi:hypothetical protein